MGNSYQIPRKNTQVPKILEIEGASKIDCHNCNISGEDIESLRKQKDNQDSRQVKRKDNCDAPKFRYLYLESGASRSNLIHHTIKNTQQK